jgi:UDPglucose 6-dehydrogenase
MSQPLKICVVGSGYVGLVAAACLAEIGHKVVCVDIDRNRVAQLVGGVVPIHEERLPELLGKFRNGAVQFTCDLASAVDQSEVTFIAVGTPQESSGAADLSYVESAVVEIAQCIRGYKVVVEKSTVPVYTSEWISRLIRRSGIAADQFDVVSNPEFLREGTAVVDFLHPDRIVVGTTSPCAEQMMRRIYMPLTTGSYYARPGSVPGPLTASSPAKLIVTSPQSAELIKHASNAFLAMKISFINAVANVAEAVNGDIEEIAAGIGLDGRIGPRFLRAGIGYGGSCFPKDVAAFIHVARQKGVELRLLEEVSRINQFQQDLFFDKIRKALWTLRGKKVAALGLSFKGGTDDVRESPAIGVIRRLVEAGCRVSAFDPVATDKARQLLPSSGGLEFEANAYAAAKDADALVILTDWLEFTSLDFHRIRETMRFPLIVDGRNMFRPDNMTALGFNYISIGRVAAECALEPHWTGDDWWKADDDQSSLISVSTAAGPVLEKQKQRQPHHPCSY